MNEVGLPTMVIIVGVPHFDELPVYSEDDVSAL